MKLLDASALTSRALTDTERMLIALGGHRAEIDGMVIEAALALEADDPASGYLVLASHDRPFEETLSITLLSPRLEALDTARIEHAYAPGIVSDVEVLGPGLLGFRFLTEAPWRLQVLERPALRLPFVSEPAGVRRRGALRRRFALSHGSATG